MLLEFALETCVRDVGRGRQSGGPATELGNHSRGNGEVKHVLPGVGRGCVGRLGLLSLGSRPDGGGPDASDSVSRLGSVLRVEAHSGSAGAALNKRGPKKSKTTRASFDPPPPRVRAIRDDSTCPASGELRGRRACGDEFRSRLCMFPKRNESADERAKQPDRKRCAGFGRPSLRCVVGDASVGCSSATGQRGRFAPCRVVGCR